MNPQPEELDFPVRRYVYEVVLARGYPPTLAEMALHLRAPASGIRDTCRRLAASHVLVLQPDSGEILMASPFSAVPTPFVVELGPGGYSCFGNCIWDALGIVAMTGRDASIKTACADCGTAMEVRVSGGAVHYTEGLAHFAIPARRWWDDIVFN
jgi:Alkylmercury lyase